MRGSLQEQLLKAGLIKKEPANKNKKMSAPSSEKPKKETAKPVKAESIPKLAPRKELADNELEKPVKLQIKQILRDNRVDNKAGEIPYNYSVASQIKRCYVTQEQLEKLTSADLAIVNWNDRSYLIPSTLLTELQVLHPDLRFFIMIKNEHTDQSDNDPYKDFPIPDDLSW